MAKLFRKGKVKKIVAIVLGLVTVAGAVFGVSALAKYAKEEQKTIKPTFSVGGLTEMGVYEETDDTIYTKNAFEAKGLEIKLDFDSNVKYQVFFYDKLDKFISCTEVYTESQNISVPLEACARLEVTPIWGADAPLEKEIKWYETAKYANQLEIRVDKRQELLEKDFTRYYLTDTNVFVLNAKKIVSLETFELTDTANTDTYEFTSLDKYNKMYFKCAEDFDFTDLYFITVRKTDGTIERIYAEFFENYTIDNLLDLSDISQFYFSLPSDVDPAEFAMMFAFI